MTERGLPSTDGAPACPFVAFGDDRDGRSTSPDHRHRCFAESPPAPRAVAHQEAYCLSSAFPVCPTFQDWARREAAHTRGVGERPETAPTAVPSPGPIAEVDAIDDVPPRAPADDPPVHRNPPRDWAAPPPWATGGAGPGRTPASGATDPAAADLLAGRAVEGHGLAGSAADRLAGGPGPAVTAAAWSASGAGAAASSADDDLAGLVQGRPPSSPPRSDGYPPSSRPPVRQPVPTRPSGDAIPGPAWEGMRRYEAYPEIKARAGLPGLPGFPGLPRFAVLAGAVAIAALALFMLPALLGIGGPSGGSSAPSRTTGIVPSASPTVKPAPTPQIYIVKTGDTMSKIAKKFGVSLDDLIAANKDTIKKPDNIRIGDPVIIPTAQAPSPQPVTSASPSARASVRAP
jgi:LysM repeat protein